jgi:hypothetical protein
MATVKKRPERTRIRAKTAGELAKGRIGRRRSIEADAA